MPNVQKDHARVAGVNEDSAGKILRWDAEAEPLAESARGGALTACCSVTAHVGGADEFPRPEPLPRRGMPWNDGGSTVGLARPSPLAPAAAAGGASSRSTRRGLPLDGSWRSSEASPVRQHERSSPLEEEQPRTLPGGERVERLAAIVLDDHLLPRPAPSLPRARRGARGSAPRSRRRAGLFRPGLRGGARAGHSQLPAPVRASGDTDDWDCELEIDPDRAVLVHVRRVGIVDGFCARRRGRKSNRTTPSRIEADEARLAGRFRVRSGPRRRSGHALVEVRHPDVPAGSRANVLHAIPDWEGALHPSLPIDDYRVPPPARRLPAAACSREEESSPEQLHEGREHRYAGNLDGSNVAAVSANDDVVRRERRLALGCARLGRRLRRRSHGHRIGRSVEPDANATGRPSRRARPKSASVWASRVRRRRRCPHSTCPDRPCGMVPLMPLIHVHLRAGRSSEQEKSLLDGVHTSFVEHSRSPRKTGTAPARVRAGALRSEVRTRRRVHRSNRDPGRSLEAKRNSTASSSRTLDRRRGAGAVLDVLVTGQRLGVARAMPSTSRMTTDVDRREGPRSRRRTAMAGSSSGRSRRADSQGASGGRAPNALMQALERGFLDRDAPCRRSREPPRDAAVIGHL